MPYDPQQKDPNDPNQNPQNELSPQASVGPDIGPVTTSSAPGAGPGHNSKGSAPQATPAQPFQNLQAYLSANAPQVADQGNRIAGDLTSQYGQIQSDINAKQADFDKQVQGGYAKPNQELVDKAVASPTDFVSDPNNVKAFQDLYNNAYRGPDAFETTGEYGDLNAKVSKAASDASLLGSNAGLQTYFQGQNPNSTKGGSILDSVLLQGTPEAYGKVKSAAQSFSNLPEYLSGAANTSDAAAEVAKNEAEQEKSDLQSKFNGDKGIIPTTEQQFENRLSNAKTTAQQSADRIKDFFGYLKNEQLQDVFGLKGDPNLSKMIQSLTDADLASIGITRDQAHSLANANMQGKRLGVSFDPQGGYLTQQNADVAIRPENFASEEDYKTAAALSKLTGQNLDSWLNQADSVKAGTAPSTLSNYKFKESGKALLDLINQEMARRTQSGKSGYDTPYPDFT